MVLLQMRLSALAVLLIVVLVVYLISTSKPRRDGYADQVVHGVGGGIAGPIVDLRRYGFKEEEQAPFVF
jgi:hypothetical protein